MSIRRHAKNRKLLTVILVAGLVAFFWAGKLFLDAIYVPVILMYHSVGEECTALDGYDRKLNVFPRAFAKQMKFLNDRGYKVIPLAEFIERIRRGEGIPRKTIAITFDDGVENNFYHAYPALKRYDFPATIFVAIDFIGKQKFLDWAQIKTMQEDNISIGSHTVSHSWLPSLSEEGVLRELVDSKKILESVMGCQIETLSYPLGGFNREVLRIAKEAGYIGAVTTSPGRKYPDDDPYALKRIRVSMTADNLFVFWIETSGYYTFIKEHRDED
ncbi:MAG: polysaccharide deacetylase family protein [Candidatus Omnitrophota bacterium]